VWMFDGPPPAHPYWWSQHIAPEDRELFRYITHEFGDERISATFTQAHIAAMRRAIDRARREA